MSCVHCNQPINGGYVHMSENGMMHAHCYDLVQIQQRLNDMENKYPFIDPQLAFTLGEKMAIFNEFPWIAVGMKSVAKRAPRHFVEGFMTYEEMEAFIVKNIPMGMQIIEVFGEKQSLPFTITINFEVTVP